MAKRREIVTTDAGPACGFRLPVGSLNSPYTYVVKTTNVFRLWLEHAVAKANDGTVSLWHACRISTAVRCERQCRVLELKLKDKGSEMEPAHWLACVEKTIRFSEARDKAVKELGLDATNRPADPYDFLDVEIADDQADPPSTEPLEQPATAPTHEDGPQAEQVEQVEQAEHHATPAEPAETEPMGEQDAAAGLGEG